MKKRVVVALSGGVDSSVAAYLLKKDGYEVISVYMKNWHDDSVTISKECPWLEDSNDAMLVAQSLQIPFQVVDLSNEYKKEIVDYMYSEYAEGRTPNPDILCNKKIKFDVFLRVAKMLKADYIATGHYSRVLKTTVKGKINYHLLSSMDKNKDQSYFLCQLSQAQLQHVIFPIGGLLKDEVRKVAKDNNLVTANKKDSQGLCFVGKVKLPDFLQQKLKPKIGKIIEIPVDSNLYHNLNSNFLYHDNEIYNKVVNDIKYTYNDGKIIGEHNGAHFYTIGQRKGLKIGGTKKPLYVIGVNTVDNIVFVGQGDNHPGLYKNYIYVKRENIHWVQTHLELPIGKNCSYSVRFRYQQKLQNATIYSQKNGLLIFFDGKQKAITKGQYAAWYDGEELIGSGVIS